MILAKLSDETVVLGLSRENVERLIAGQPIRITKESHGVELPGIPRLVIVFGETEKAIADELNARFNRLVS
jgi:hypothetical protein